MPEELKEQILPLLMQIFPDEVRNTDSKIAGEKFTYKSVHFTWYNRFSKGVSVQEFSAIYAYSDLSRERMFRLT